MALSDDLTTALAAKPRCKLYQLGLSDDEMAQIELYVGKIREDEGRSEKLFTIAGLTRILNDNGHRIGKTVISEHVRQVCLCER